MQVTQLQLQALYCNAEISKLYSSKQVLWNLHAVIPDQIITAGIPYSSSSKYL